MGVLAVFMDLICPSLGVVMATVMFGAPIVDLRKALLNGTLGDLNPFPWAIMTGNCLGWVVYGYYLQPSDPFLVAANIPGLILSIWLNSGAAKLQYQEMQELRRLDRQSQAHQEEWDASPPNDDSNDLDAEIMGLNDRQRRQERRRQGRGPRPPRPVPGGGTAYEFHPDFLVMTPQERALMQMLVFWILVIVWVGWIGRPINAAPTVGIVVNINLIFFYGAPLKTIQQVIWHDKHSNSIHRPTMYMNWTNTTFWILYGFAKMDLVIVIPNATGLSLGLVQGLLCFFYPPTTPTASGSSSSPSHQPVPTTDNDDDDDDPANDPVHSNSQSVVQARQPDTRPITAAAAASSAPKTAATASTGKSKK
ncbi:hypothetical protein ACA910_013422 [Epithemia clementina (nom. ined.)]